MLIVGKNEVFKSTDPKGPYHLVEEKSEESMMLGFIWHHLRYNSIDFTGKHVEIPTQNGNVAKMDYKTLDEMYKAFKYYDTIKHLIFEVNR